MAAAESGPPLYERLPPELWAEIVARLDDDVRLLCALARQSRLLRHLIFHSEASAALWTRAHQAMFGTRDWLDCPVTCTRDGVVAARSECCEAAATIVGWQRCAQRAPSELRLPAMLQLRLGSTMAASLHDGRLLRLWDPSDGTRLACESLAREPSCLFLDEPHARLVVGDHSGMLTLLPTQSIGEAMKPRRGVRPMASGQPLTDVLLMADGRAATVGSKATAEAPATSPSLLLAATAAGVVGYTLPADAELETVAAEAEVFAIDLRGEAAQAKVQLADVGDGEHVVLRQPGTLRLLDVHTARWAWQCTELAPFTDDEAGVRGMRSVCASRGLRVLASSHSDAVRLWDVRTDAAIAELQTRGGLCTHVAFDEAGLGFTWGGEHALLVASQLVHGKGGGMSVLDIRRLDRCTPSRAHLVTVWLPSRASGRSKANDAALSVSFDAYRGMLVATAGAREQTAFCWRSGADVRAQPRSDSPVAAQAPAAVVTAASSTPRSARTKPKRQVSGARGRNNGAPGGGRRKQ